MEMKEEKRKLDVVRGEAPPITETNVFDLLLNNLDGTLHGIRKALGDQDPDAIIAAYDRFEDASLIMNFVLRLMTQEIRRLMKYPGFNMAEYKRLTGDGNLSSKGVDTDKVKIVVDKDTIRFDVEKNGKAPFTREAPVSDPVEELVKQQRVEVRNAPTPGENVPGHMVSTGEIGEQIIANAVAAGPDDPATVHS